MFTTRSKIDMRNYPVVQSMHNSPEAADMLAKLNRANLTVIKYMKQKYKGTVHEKHINRLDQRYNPDVLGEHIPIGKKNTSYVTDKGKKIRFCLRPEYDRSTIHDWNILVFVSMHEISHIMNITMGHESDFWSTFKFILSNAVEIGLYEPVDYDQYPIVYCNLEVTYNPLYDDSLASVV